MTGPDSDDRLKQPPEEYRETRPWGSFRRLVHDEPCTVKLITVLPGERLSLQSHRYRSELWLFLDPGGVVEIDGETSKPDVGETCFIPCGAKHRLATSADAAAPVRVVEMGFGTFDEDDIVRYDDQYGRT
ncbi:MAG: phosphomannose isomerase type II C-terminal cupin domain [Acidimicrobiales bacterium]